MRGIRPAEKEIKPQERELRLPDLATGKNSPEIKET
jgi:hypothetical protein